MLAISIKLLVNYDKGDLRYVEGVKSLGVLIYLLVQSAALVVFLLNLIVLHVWLWKEGISTYEYVKRKREKKGKRSGSVAPDASRTGGE